jgi:hypothetical protein
MFSDDDDAGYYRREDAVLVTRRKECELYIGLCYFVYAMERSPLHEHDRRKEYGEIKVKKDIKTTLKKRAKRMEVN